MEDLRLAISIICLALFGLFTLYTIYEYISWKVKYKSQVILHKRIDIMGFIYSLYILYFMLAFLGEMAYVFGTLVGYILDISIGSYLIIIIISNSIHKVEATINGISVNDVESIIYKALEELNIPHIKEQNNKECDKDIEILNCKSRIKIRCMRPDSKQVTLTVNKVNKIKDYKILLDSVSEKINAFSKNYNLKDKLGDVIILLICYTPMVLLCLHDYGLL